MEDNSKKSIVDKMKSELEDLEIQLNLGRKDLIDTFEKGKKRFAEKLRNLRSNISEYEKTGSEKVEQLKKKSSSLLDTLESDFDISYTEYSEKTHNLKSGIEDLENVVKEYYKEFEGKSREVKSKAEQELKYEIEKFKSELELQQIYLKHLKEKSVEDWEEWKKGKLEEVKSLKNKLEETVHTSKEKAAKFNEEVVEAYRHLRSAFKNLK